MGLRIVRFRNDEVVRDAARSAVVGKKGVGCKVVFRRSYTMPSKPKRSLQDVVGKETYTVCGWIYSANLSLTGGHIVKKLL
jgi:hypothetical protein